MNLPTLRSARPYALSLLSGLLLAGAYDPWNIPMLAWIGLLPVLAELLPIKSESRCKSPFLLGWVMGLTFWIATIHWLSYVSAIGMLLLCAYLACYQGAWAFLISRCRNQWPEPKGWWHVLIAAYGTCSWVALEWVRGWLLGGFPWNFAATSQHKNLMLIQVVEWTGVYGVSFVLIFFNIAFWLTARRMWVENFSARSWRYEFSVAIFLVTICLFIGMRHLLNLPSLPGQESIALKVALIQPDIPQDVKYEPMSRMEQTERLENLSKTAAAAKPDLIIWPETALVDGPSYDISSKYWLEDLVKELQIPLLIGTLDSALRPVDVPDKVPGRVKFFNAALLVKPDGRYAKPYRKRHLVPFGEYVPFEKTFPWLRKVTPIQGSFTAGGDPALISLGDLQLGAVICFEDTLPQLSRELVQKGADVIVNLTNDAWFKTSSESAMHAANSIFRAVETRRPLIRCSNHGQTLIVAATGAVQNHLKPFSDGFLFGSVQCTPKRPLTFYTRHGDWLPWTCIVFMALCVGAATASGGRD